MKIMTCIGVAALVILAALAGYDRWETEQAKAKAAKADEAAFMERVKLRAKQWRAERDAIAASKKPRAP